MELHRPLGFSFTPETYDAVPDGVFTISDVWLWLQWLFLYPGDVLIYLVGSIGGLQQFFEISNESFGGWASGLLSVAFWLAFAFYVLVMHVRDATARRDLAS